jgi:outer membrane protein
MEIPVLDSFEIEKPVLVDPTPTLLPSNQDICDKALTLQPQITSAAIRSNNALLSIRIYEGARWPRLNLNANVNTNFAGSSRASGSGVNPEDQKFFNQLWNNLGESLGLGLSIPIYSNRQIRSNIDRATINAMTARLNEQNTKNQLRKSIEQTYTDLINAMKKFEATREQLTYSEISYKNMEIKFNIGLVPATDFIVEKKNYMQAQSTLIQAKYNYLFTSKILDFYLGKPIQL